MFTDQDNELLRKKIEAVSAFHNDFRIIRNIPVLLKANVFCSRRGVVSSVSAY